MSDSQMIDYLQITQSLLAVPSFFTQNRKEWEEVPEIVCLTIKAVSHLLSSHSESFQQHKTLINEQSLKIKELQLKLGSKINRKDLEGEVANYMKVHYNEKREEDLISQYEKLVKESRYEKDRNENITAEELKTISEIVADKKILQFEKVLEAKAIAQRLEMQEKIISFKEELKNKISNGEKDIRDVRDRLSEFKQVQSRIQESHQRSVSSNNDEKLNYLEHSTKRMNDSLNHIIGHIQLNYFTKEEVAKIIDNMKNQKDKSPIKPKGKQEGKSKHRNEEETDYNQMIDQKIAKIKEKEGKQWLQFRQGIMKELGKMVKIEVVNNLIDSFHKEILQRYNNLSTTVNKLQNKLHKNQSFHEKEIITVKSEKRPEKRSSPNKSIESIHTSLVRLEKTITQKNASQIRRIQTYVEQKLNRYDSKLINELDRRQKHLCQVIEETYNQNLRVKNKESSSELNKAVETLFQSNMFCRYLYIGTKDCKKQSLIPWEKEVLNSLTDNYLWKNETIVVNGPGLYRVQFAMFGEIETETHFLLNGEPISVINKPQIINSSSKKVKGSYYHEFVLLPSKSRLSFRVNQNFYGQAVLSLQKL